MLLAVAAVASLAACGDGDAVTPAKTTGLVRTPFQQAEIARKQREQRAHVSPGQVGRDLAGLPGVQARAGLRRALRNSILLDARRRARTGRLHGPFIGVSCRPIRADRALARTNATSAPVLRYDCLAISFRSTTSPPMQTGTPFLARIDYRARSYAWCLFTPVGGEGTYSIKTLVPPPAACTAR